METTYTIHKFSLGRAISRNDDLLVVMPRGAKIIDAQIQDTEICIWAQIDPSQTYKEGRYFRILGTDWDWKEPIMVGIISCHLEHISTMQAPPFVWHLMERVLDDIE